MVHVWRTAVISLNIQWVGFLRAIITYEIFNDILAVKRYILSVPCNWRHSGGAT